MNLKLTDEQRAILEEYNRNLFISAAPGSGKSTILSLLADRILAASPSNRVMLITFTRKAAKGIIDKCATLDKSRIIGGTFHSIAYKMLKQVGISRTICDENKKRLIIKRIFNCKKDKDRFEYLYEHISHVKATFVQNCATGRDTILKQYNSALSSFQLWDFDDIILRWIYDYPSQALQYPDLRSTPTHLLIDELQDTSGSQLEMLKQICNLDQRITYTIGVGDDDQAIYNWRNARQENVEDFIAHFKCKVMHMGINFRSLPCIVNRTALLIKQNNERIGKPLRSARVGSGIVLGMKEKDPLKEIDTAIQLCKINHGKQIAILYRNRSLKYYLEFALRRASLEYVVNDSLEIVDRSAVRIMLSNLRLASGEFDIYDLEIASKALRRLGTRTVLRIRESAETEGKSVPRLVSEWIKDPKRGKRLTSIGSLQLFFRTNPGQILTSLVIFAESFLLPSFEYPDNLKEFIRDITKDYKINPSDVRELFNELGLNGGEEEIRNEANIELSTVHGYKGMERDIVIMPWCQQYLEPRYDKPIDLEAERRLFYVGATRARDELYMLYSGVKPQFIREMNL